MTGGRSVRLRGPRRGDGGDSSLRSFVYSGKCTVHASSHSTSGRRDNLARFLAQLC